MCPVKVNLSEQIYRWRQNLDSLGKADPMKKAMSAGMEYLFGHPGLYSMSLRFAPLANHLPRLLMYNKLNGWGIGHEMPEFPRESFQTMWKKGEVK